MSDNQSKFALKIFANIGDQTFQNAIVCNGASGIARYANEDVLGIVLGMENIPPDWASAFLFHYTGVLSEAQTDRFISATARNINEAYYIIIGSELRGGQIQPLVDAIAPNPGYAYSVLFCCHKQLVQNQIDQLVEAVLLSPSMAYCTFSSCSKLLRDSQKQQLVNAVIGSTEHIGYMLTDCMNILTPEQVGQLKAAIDR